MRSALRTAVLFGFTAASAGGQGVAAGTAEAIVSKAERNYKALTSMQANFEWSILDSQIGNSESKGVMYQAGADRFALRYSQPAGQFFLIDGKFLYIYEPVDLPKQVLKRSPPLTPEFGVNPVGAFLEKPIERYDLLYLREEKLNGQLAYVVQLRPKQKMEFRRATVWFDSVDGLPRKMEFDINFGKQTIRLTNLQRNQVIPASIFQFVQPRGTKIVGP